MHQDATDGATAETTSKLEQTAHHPCHCIEGVCACKHACLNLPVPVYLPASCIFLLSKQHLQHVEISGRILAVVPVKGEAELLTWLHHALPLVAVAKVLRGEGEEEGSETRGTGKKGSNRGKKECQGCIEGQVREQW